MRLLYITTLLLFLFNFPLTLQAGDREDFYHRTKKSMTFPYHKIKRYECDSIIYQDSCVKVTFEFEYIPLNGVKYLMVDILNKTEDRIYIEWENVKINKSKINFLFDSKLKNDFKKEDECIFDGESSGYRFLQKDLEISASNVESKDIYLRKNGDSQLQVRLPIRFDEKTKDYKFVFKFEKYSESEIDSLNNLRNDIEKRIKFLKKGMSRSEVESIMGKPFNESVMKSGWGGSRWTKFYPSGVKKGDLVLCYPFYNVYIRKGVMAKAAEVIKYD